jgi:hypothetical protein
MTFLQQLMLDASPKAETIKKAAKNITTRVVDSKAVQTSKALGYKAVVNTVGIGLVLAEPAVSKVWSTVEGWASTPKEESK